METTPNLITESYAPQPLREVIAYGIALGLGIITTVTAGLLAFAITVSSTSNPSALAVPTFAGVVLILVGWAGLGDDLVVGASEVYEYDDDDGSDY